MPTKSPQLANLLKLVDTPRDGALLRFSLGSEYLKTGELEPAISHLEAAIRKDPGYSAAWKLLGKALGQTGRKHDALATYREGIVAAQKKGDLQALREMSVFVRRLEKELETRS